MGDAMSAPVKAAGDGVPVKQTIDPTILSTFPYLALLDKAAAENKTVENGTTFEVNIARPVVLAVTIEYDDINNRPGITFRVF